MSQRVITVFYAWQSDLEQKTNRNFIRHALDAAAARITEDSAVEAEVLIDADTEGVVGTPPVTETILKKIDATDIFVPDLTFVTKTEAGKLVPNPNVMIEYGYALRSLTFKSMMPVMNMQFGLPDELPFDMAHVRHPIQYSAAPDMPDGSRREERNKLSERFEGILRLMIQDILSRSRADAPLFVPKEPIRRPGFFFKRQDVLVNFGQPGEQELRFKRDRAIYIRLFPKFAEQPRVGLTRAIATARKLKPPLHIFNPLVNRNDWGAINLEPHGDGITAFTQIFESGELWGVSEMPFPSKDALVTIAAEKGYMEALENYRLIYERELALKPPFMIEFGATGLKDHYLLFPSLEFPSTAESAGPIRSTSISHRYQLNSFDREEWVSVLKEFLIEFYDLAARDRAQVLTDQLVAAHQLPPL